MAYLENFEELLKEKCYQNERPGCAAACPFGLDILDLEKKWQSGRFNAAHRVFQNTVGFPGIVAAACDHPCERHCIRSEIDAPVALNMLERTAVALATRKDPNAYNMPAKPNTCAIVGGGISGLACALFLCNKKYQVTVFEKSDHLGGSLRDSMDKEVFDADIATQFKYEKLNVEYGRHIKELSELADYDAVYVAVGAGAEDFDLQPNGIGAYASTQDGVFFGGAMTGSTHMEAMADGLAASRAIERFFKTGLMNQPFEQKGTRLVMDTSRYEKKEPVLPSEGAVYSSQEAANEAGRCVMCRCDACMRACDLMSYFEKTPRRVYEEVYVTIRPGTLSRDGTMATRLISTCNQCGVCKEVCPEHIDFGQFFADSMKAMQAKGTMPWAYHDYWLRDMEHANGEAEVFISKTAKPKYLFFPGCQMGASDPGYVKKTYEWLLSKNPETALWVHCCGAPAEWAGETALHEALLSEIRSNWESLGRPELVLGCPTCMQMYDRFLPEISYSSIYDIMLDKGIGPEHTDSGASYAIFDACAARDYPELRANVRSLLRKTGIYAEELSHEAGSLPCCSFGGHASIAAPKYSKNVTKKRLESTDKPMLVYCANCRDSFGGQGREAYHILDLLYGINREQRSAPTVTVRRENREALKADLLYEYEGISPSERTKMKLYMDAEVRQGLSDDLILEDDVAAVIEHCETEDRKIMDSGTGHFTGHLKIGHMTYWAEYAPAGDGFELFHAYAHRMCLEAEDEK